MNLRCENVDWIQQRLCVKKVINFCVPKGREFLDRLNNYKVLKSVRVSFSQRQVCWNISELTQGDISCVSAFL